MSLPNKITDYVEKMLNNDDTGNDDFHSLLEFMFNKYKDKWIDPKEACGEVLHSVGSVFGYDTMREGGF